MIKPQLSSSFRFYLMTIRLLLKSLIAFLKMSYKIVNPKKIVSILVNK